MQTSATGIYNLSTSNDQEEIQSSEVAVISTNIELQHVVQRNTEMLEQLSRNRIESISITPVMVANGQPLNILGVIPVNISIAGIKCNHEVMITNDIAHDCLLGTDFLIPHACTIDLKQHRLLIGNKSTGLITTEQAMQSRKRVCHISLSSTTVIHDREEKLLWAEVRHPEGEEVSYPGVVEPREEVLSKHPIMIARVLAIPGEDKLIPIRITNLTIYYTV